MAKPTDVPEWATDDDFATGPAPVIGTPTKVDPGALSGQGFVPGTAAAAQIMNWLLNRNGRWAKWLDELFEDDGSHTQVKRGLLQLVHAVQADIVAGDVSGAYARLRGEPGIAHTVASAVEDAVYASLTSWASDERARLTLRGAIREIRGRDVAGANAPIIIPHGLNVGASFTPPAGYLPGEPTYFTTPGVHTWTAPEGMRAVLFDVVGAGGGATRTTAQAWGGGGGAYATRFMASGLPASATVNVGAAGVSGNAGDATDGGNSSVSFPGNSIAAFGGKASGEGGDVPSGTSQTKHFGGHHGSGGNVHGEGGGTSYGAGGSSGAGWGGRGGSVFVSGTTTGFRSPAEDGVVRITPYF